MNRELTMNQRRIRLIFLDALSHLISTHKLPVIPYERFLIKPSKNVKQQIKGWLNELHVILADTKYTLTVTSRIGKRIIQHPYFKCTDTDVCFKHIKAGAIIGNLNTTQDEEFFIMEISVTAVKPSIETHHVGIHNTHEVIWINRNDPTDVEIFNYASEQEIEEVTGLTYRNGKLYKKNSLTSLCTPYLDK